MSLMPCNWALVSGGTAAALAFCRACVTFRAPGITVVTPGGWMIHPGGHRHRPAGVGRQELPDEPLAAAVTVDIGGVQERDAGLRGRVQYGQRAGLVDLSPVRPELPGAQADHRDGTAGPAQNAFFHGGRS